MKKQALKKRPSPKTKKIAVKKAVKTVEIEQEVSRKVFISVLGELLNALGKGKLDVSFPLNKKQEIFVPAKALKNATFEVELEDSGRECELELSLHWKKTK